MRAIDLMLRDYQDLTATDHGLWGAFCWTVIRPTLPRDELTARVGTSVSWAEQVDPDEFGRLYVPDEPGEADSAAWVVSLDDALGLLEANGFAGSRPANLAALSFGAVRVVSFYWNEAITRCTLSVAVGGDVEQYDILDDYDDLDDVPQLRQAIEDVRAVRGSRDVVAQGLAMVEILSGIALDRGLLVRSWPVVSFASHIEQRRLSPEQEELASLAAVFAAASPEQQNRALAVLVEHLIDATGLDDEPAAVRFSERLRQGAVVGADDGLTHLAVRLQDEAPPLPRSGKVDVHHPGWRRLQAGAALHSMNREDRTEAILHEYGPLYHARWALDDQWAAARAEFLAILAQA